MYSNRYGDDDDDHQRCWYCGWYRGISVDHVAVCFTYQLAVERFWRTDVGVLGADRPFGFRGAGMSTRRGA
jgi:hypothetical protein